ncbi:MAG: DNA polymerase IV [Clostridia bacterium]|nr:DNA polymerase IV [Clostridia bacterium]
MNIMRIILHSDINNCYAAIESISHPEYKKIPIAVGGDPEKRHGIILAKNELAKKCGVKTGEALWQAKAKCPSLLILPPNFPLYQKYCNMAKELYLEYTDLVESFGPDEAWLDVTGSTELFGSGEMIAEEIRRRMKTELGLTVSIGVSFNKVFAKFGSDYKKPDAVTSITHENYKEIVWPAPVGELLFAGHSTVRELNRRGIFTIGDIAEAGKERLSRALGKNGERLYFYASGLDTTPVMHIDETIPIKTIGNSTTPPRDLKNFEDAKIILYILSESVAKRLRGHSLLCSGVQIHLRSSSLMTQERQKKLEFPTNLSETICKEGLELLRRTWNFSEPLRSIGIRAIDLSSDKEPQQFSLWRDEEKEVKKENLELTVQKIRDKYGKESIVRSVILSDPVLGTANKPRLEPPAFRTH